MDSYQYQAMLKMFTNRRLQPNIPEHAVFIAGEIAKLEITEPQDAANYKEFYDRRMEEYKAAHPEEFATPADVLKEVTADGTVTMDDLQKIADASNVLPPTYLTTLPIQNDAPVEPETTAPVTEEKPKKRGRKAKVS